MSELSSGGERQALGVRVRLDRLAGRDHPEQRRGEFGGLVERDQLAPVVLHLLVVLRSDLESPAAVEPALDVALVLKDLEVLVDRRDRGKVQMLCDLLEAWAVVVLGDELRYEVQHVFLAFGEKHNFSFLRCLL